MLKAYDLPNGLRLILEEGTQPEGAVEHKSHAAPSAKKPEPKEEPKPEPKKAAAKKAAAPKNKKAPAKNKK